MSRVLCPGCGLDCERDTDALYDGYYQAAPECWAVYTRVLGVEFGDAIVFGKAHQLTVDAYACQHAGGDHPDKSVAIHLAGLHLVLERGFDPPTVPLYLQRIANQVREWPHFPPPSEHSSLTVASVAAAESASAHIEASRAWAGSVWALWSAQHAAVQAWVAAQLAL